MPKKPTQTAIDTDLQSLYDRAKTMKTTVTCPNCQKDHDIITGGDFSEMARAMELRIKYEALKNRNSGPIVPNFFGEEDA